MPHTLSLDLISEAATYLSGRVRRTPLEPSPVMTERLGVPVWLKLENLQITGSFKVRGAWFACSRLMSEGIREIATCSAGNHGLGVAHAAQSLGMKARIFVPASIDESKRKAMLNLGAEVITSEFRGYDQTERWALLEAQRLELPFLSAFDDERVMAGNGGSVALEVLDQLPDARTFIMPVGGGGHAAGFSFAVSERLKSPRFVYCQHDQSPALRLSLEKGEPVTELPPIETIAHGLEGGFGVKTFAVLTEVLSTLQESVAEDDAGRKGAEQLPSYMSSAVWSVSPVTEAEIRDAMRWMMVHHRFLIEGSAAAAVAACLKTQLNDLPGPIVVFISGRNVGLEALRSVLCESPED